VRTREEMVDMNTQLCGWHVCTDAQSLAQMAPHSTKVPAGTPRIVNCVRDANRRRLAWLRQSRRLAQSNSIRGVCVEGL